MIFNFKALGNISTDPAIILELFAITITIIITTTIIIITTIITTTIISIILKEGKGGTLLPLFVCLCASREEDWGERNHIDQGSEHHCHHHHHHHHHRHHN